MPSKLSHVDLVFWFNDKTIKATINADGTYSQWGEDTPALGENVDRLEAMAHALVEDQ